MKHITRFSTLLIVVFLAARALLPGSAVRADSTIIVKPSSPNGWTLAKEGNSGTASGSFVAGPDTAPLGNGSVQFVVDSAGGYAAGAQVHLGTRLDQIEALEYTSYRNSGSAALAVSLQFTVDFNLDDADTTFQGRLVYEPYYTETVSSGVWQTWNPLVGKWWATRAPFNATCSMAAPCTLAQVLAAYPNAGIHATIGSVVLKAGSGWTGGFTGNADALKITIGGEQTIYDFEPEEQCTTTCYVNATTGDNAFGGDTPGSAKKTIQAAINQVTSGGKVIVAEGTYPEVLTINKPLSLEGAQKGVLAKGRGGAQSIIDNNTGSVSIEIQADNVTIDGFKFDSVNSTSPWILLALQSPGGDGYQDLSVLNNEFITTPVSSGGAGTGGMYFLNQEDLLIEGNFFNDTGSHAVFVAGTSKNTVYQNNDSYGNYLSNFSMHDQKHTDVKILNNRAVEDSLVMFNADGATIEDNSFEGSVSFTSRMYFGGGSKDVEITDNNFTDTRAAPIIVLDAGFGYGANSSFSIENNEINFDAGVASGATTALIDLRGVGGTNTVTGNTINVSGTLTKDALYGINLRGAMGATTITDNEVDGGNADSSPATPSMGIRLASDLSGGAEINVNLNEISGWTSGVLAENGAVLTNIEVAQNNIVGNSTFGVSNNAAGLLDAEENWWGSASGPGPVGPGTGDKVSTNVDFCVWLDAPAPGGSAFTLVENLDTNEVFCTIQSAIDDADTLPGHTIQVNEGTFKEQVVITKNNLTLQGAGAEDTIIQGSACFGRGISISAKSGITVKDLTVTGFEYGVFLTSAPLTDITIEDVDAVSNCRHGIFSDSFNVNGLVVDGVNASNNGFGISGSAGRGIWVINGTKQNIEITDGKFNDNFLVGIDISDGSVSNLEISGNEIKGNGDSGIGVLGANGTTLVEDNTIQNNGRYGIEIKNSSGNGEASGAGSIVVKNNTVSRTIAPTDARDYGGIVIIRRSPVAPNPDQPNGIAIIGNTVTGFEGGATGDGFGIIVAGTNHLISDNDLSDNEVGIQLQAGNPSINAQNTPYFDRDNSGTTSAEIVGNMLTDNKEGLRSIGNVTAEITENFIYENTVNGVTVLDEASTGIVVNQNALCRNTIFGASNLGNSNINMQENWWGASDGPGLVGPGSGDKISTAIDFANWLTTDITGGLCADANNAPEVTANDVTVSEGDTVNHNVSAIDPDGDSVSLSASDTPAFAIFTDNGDGTGTFVISPDFNDAGEYTVTVTATDGALNDSDTFKIKVTKTNRAPEVEATDQTVAENATADYTVTASDADGDTLSFSTSSLPAFVSFVDNGNNTGTFTFAPGFNDAGTYPITVTVSDGDDSDSASFNLYVTDTNRAPSVTANNVTVQENVTETHNVSATDPDGDSLTLSSDEVLDFVSFVDNGDGTGTFTITPSFGDAGNYNITVTANDGKGGSGQDTFILSVGDVNRPPSITTVDQTVAEGATLDYTVSAADEDGDALTLTTSALPAFASFADNGDGTGTFTFAPGFTDADDYNITVTVSDGDLDDDSTFKLTVTNINRAPAIDAADQTVAENTDASYIVSATDSDTDDTLSLTLTTLLPNFVSFTDNGDGTGTFEFAPGYNDSGEYNITVKVTDESGESDMDTFKLTVTNVNRAPVVDAQNQSVNEGETVDYTVTATDADGDALTLTTSALPAFVSFVDNGDNTGTFTIAPEFGDAGNFNVTITADDGEDTGSDTFTISVGDVNRPPSIDTVDQAVAENSTKDYTVTATDADGDAITLTTSALPAFVSFVDNGNGTGKFTFAPGFGDAGDYNITVTASDGTLDSSDTFKLTVTDNNRAPEIDAADQSVVEGTTEGYTVTASDADGDTLTLSASGLPDFVSFVDNGNGSGTFTFAPGFDDEGSYSITVSVSDGQLSDSDTFNLVVTGENQAPIANDDNVTTGYQTAVNIAVLVNDSDPDGDLLTVSIATNPALGTVVVNNNGTITYTPNAGASGSDSFTYTISDGNGGTDTATVFLTIIAPQPCDVRDLRVDLRGRISGGGTIGEVTNVGQLACTYQYGMASYKKFDEVIDNQEIFDYVNPTEVIQPNETKTLNVAVPACAAQVDVFYGPVLLSLKGQRYGVRLLAAVHINGRNYCVPEVDTDGDGTFDLLDATPNGDIDGDGIDNKADPTPNGDTDSDGVDNSTDTTPNGEQGSPNGRGQKNKMEKK
jgi:hypothetical protein